jgi:hypothetical protein
LIADAAGLAAEAVNEPGKFQEGGHFEDLHAADFLYGPPSSGASAFGRFVGAALCRYCFRGSHKSTSIIGVGRWAEWAAQEAS